MLACMKFQLSLAWVHPIPDISTQKLIDPSSEHFARISFQLASKIIHLMTPHNFLTLSHGSWELSNAFVW